MATPTACTIYTTKAEFYPWNTALPNSNRAQIFGLESGPHGAACPGQIRPFNPTLEAGPPTRPPAPIRLLHPEAQSRRRRPVPGQAELHHAPGPDRQPARRHLLPRGRHHRGGQHPGRSRAGEPELPGSSSEIGTSNVAAGPGSHPFHAVGKIYMAGPFQGAPLSAWSRSPRPWPGPMTTAPSSSGSPCTSTRSMPT